MQMFDGLAQAEKLYGPTFQPEDLRTKVVFLEYWRVGGNESEASFSNLIELQRKHAPSGKFTVIALQTRRKRGRRAIKFCQDHKVNFPVYQEYNEPKAPKMSDTPRAYLIDHTGKIVAKGHPTDLFGLVAALVESTPDLPPEILGEVEVKFWTAYAKNLMAGKPVGLILRTLKKEAKPNTPKGAEAKKIVLAVEKYLAYHQEKLAKKVKEQPAAAFLELRPFMNQSKGMKMAKEFKKDYDRLAKDVSLIKLSNVLKEIEEIRIKLLKKNARGLWKQLEKQKERLKAIANDPKSTPSTAKEATDKLKEINEE